MHLLRVVELERSGVRHHDGLAGVLGVVEPPLGVVLALARTLTLTLTLTMTLAAVTRGGLPPEPVLRGGMLLVAVVALTPPLLAVSRNPFGLPSVSATLAVPLVGVVGPLGRSFRGEFDQTARVRRRGGRRRRGLVRDGGWGRSQTPRVTSGLVVGLVAAAAAAAVRS